MRCHRVEKMGFGIGIPEGFDGFDLRLLYVHEFLIALAFRRSAGGGLQGELKKSSYIYLFSVCEEKCVASKPRKVRNSSNLQNSLVLGVGDCLSLDAFKIH
jgi:hypothetical protein